MNAEIPQVEGTSEGLDFFVSHAGPDTDWATWVAAQLVDAGYRVELDVWDWSAGTSFVSAMGRALADARRMVALTSPAYFTRTWSRAALDAALAKHVHAATGFLVPVAIRPCPPGEYPALLLPLVRIDLVGLGEVAARQRLLDGVAPTRRPSAGQTPVFPGAPTDRAVFPGGLPDVRNLPARNPFFTGRYEPLAELVLRLGRSDGRGRIAVSGHSGAGGVGKSQLALEYAWRNADSYRAVWWIDAEHATQVDTTTAELGTALGLPVGHPGAATTELVHAELDRLGTCLLVYDNVVDLTVLDQLPSRGHVVATTRDETVRSRMPVLRLGLFPRDETLQLLRRQVPGIADADANQIADVVGDLPLAVAQAGAFLRDTGSSPADYLRRAARQDSHEGLEATTTVALRELADSDPEALGLLRQLSFLASDPVPLTAASADGPAIGGLVVGDPATTADVVDALTRLDLAHLSGTQLIVHRRVQALVHDHIPPGGRPRVLARALRLLATASPGDPQLPATWPTYADLVPHLDAAVAALDAAGVAEPDGFRLLLVETARYLHASGQYARTRELAGRTRDRSRRDLGDDHLFTIVLTVLLAASLSRLGQPELAYPLEEDTFSRRRRLLGEDHPDTLAAANNLALVLDELKDFSAARPLHEDTLARRRRVLGFDHPDTLRSARNLAASLGDVGDLRAALPLQQDTLARVRRVSGDDHPDSLYMANNLAVTLSRLGDYPQACAVYGETLPRLRRLVGENHPFALVTANNLAFALARSGDLSTARQLYEDTLARQRQVLGVDHPDTERTAANLRALDEP